MTLTEIIDNANSNAEFIPGMSSNELFFGTSTDDRLTDVIADVAEACLGKAEADHTHTGYAAAEHSHTGYAAADHEHTGYAAAGHGHTGYAAENHSHDYAAGNHGHSYNDLSDKPTIPAAYSHPVSHPASMITGLADVATTGSYNDLSNKPTIPSIPASLPANGGNADTVDGKHAADFAAASHTHNYAAANHTHTPASLGAFSDEGGTINGDVNVAGVVRVNGQQAFYYAASSASQTIGTNNATGGTTIACGSSATVNINGANVKTANALPKASNTHTLGNTSLRWKGIYSNAAVNVSSDKRLKRDIIPMGNEALAAFIEKLNVVSFNYNEDPAEAKSRIGLIAQDVQQADADLAKFFVEEDEEGMLGMTPADLVFPLIAAVQYLSKRVAELESK